jgi:hypothetical protein
MNSWAYHRRESHLLFAIDAAQVLGNRVGQRAQLLQEAALHVLFRKPVESSCIAPLSLVRVGRTHTWRPSRSRTSRTPA